MSGKENTGKIRYWKVSPGEDAIFWDEFKDNNLIAIGWYEDEDLRKTKFGDLIKNPDKELIKKALREYSPEEDVSDRQISTWADIIKRFFEIKPGDKVIAYDKDLHINAIGEVTGEYEFNKKFDQPHVKAVKWLKIFDPPLDIRPLKNKLETNIWLPPTVIEMTKNDWDIVSRKELEKEVENKGSFTYLVANLSWNTNYWKSPSKDKTGFRYVKKGGTPTESWNFDFENPRNRDGYIHGFFQTHKPPREFRKGIVFFASRNPKDGKTYIVGVYGNAELYEKKFTNVPKEQAYTNLRAPINYTTDFSEIYILPLDKSRHLQGKRVPQVGCTYINEEYAKNILEDAIKKHEELTEGSYPNKKEIISKLNNILGLISTTKKLSKTSIPFNENFFEEFEKLLSLQRQVILFGPPGTSKTYFAKEFAKKFADEDNIEIVQFHPSYSYEDFVEGISIKEKEGKITYETESKIFKKLCKKAGESNNRKYVLIIDEINRGNLSKIFGELIFGLEYRDEKITLPYSSEKLSIPKNLYIIGTMNSADRSIALVDYALRRRFYFIEMLPDEEMLKKWLDNNFQGKDKNKIFEIFDKFNKKIREDKKLGKHYQIGHTYFFVKDEDELKLKWNYAIRPLLEEYFFGDLKEVEEFRKEFDGIIG